MTPDQAEALAARTLAAIDATDTGHRSTLGHRIRTDHRARVASDLAGLRDCYGRHPIPLDRYAAHAARYTDGLRRTAALYGVTEDDSLWDDKADAARAEYLEDR